MVVVVAPGFCPAELFCGRRVVSWPAPDSVPVELSAPETVKSPLSGAPAAEDGLSPLWSPACELPGLAGFPQAANGRSSSRDSSSAIPLRIVFAICFSPILYDRFRCGQPALQRVGSTHSSGEMSVSTSSSVPFICSRIRMPQRMRSARSRPFSCFQEAVSFCSSQAAHWDR